jgi:quinohemoprotein ethanol dehydrogenase
MTRKAKAAMDMILATVKVKGVDRKVIMQAPTNGFFYVLDRLIGELLSADKLGKVTWAERIDLKTG